MQRAEDSRAAAAFTSPVKAVVRERADADDDVLTQKMADSLAQARACGRRGVEALRANELEMAVQEFALVQQRILDLREAAQVDASTREE